ncbi:MAG: hypothetical protein WCV91_00850 [Candidatus Margulisiibacteriota bacterium]
MPVYIPVNLKELEGVIGLQDNENYSAACEGAQVYMRSEDIPQYIESLTKSVDTASIRSSASSSVPQNVTGPNPRVDDPNYIRNTGEEDSDDSTIGTSRQAITGSSGAEGASGTTGTEGAEDSAIDKAYDEAEQKFKAATENLEEDDYIISGGKYPLPDSERLEALYQEAMAQAYIMLILTKLIEGREKRKAVAIEINTGIKVGGSGGADVEESINLYISNLNSFITQVFTTCLERAQEIYEKEYGAADEKCDSTGEKIGDFFTGGGYSQDVMEARIEATRKFKEAVGEMIKSLIKVLYAVSPVGLEAAKGLEGIFVDRPNGYVDIDTNKLLSLRRKLSAEGDKQLLTIDVLLLQSDLSDIVLQLALQISTTSSGRKLLTKVAQAQSVHVLGMFDQIANLSMLKKQLHNQMNFDKLQLEKLEDSQVWNVASMIFMIVAIVASIIVSFCTYGSTSFITFSLIGVASGMAAGGTRYAGAAIADANVEDEFIPLDQFQYDSFALDEGAYRDVDETVSVLNDLDRREYEILRKRMNASMLKEGSDGFQAIDYQPFMQAVDERESISDIRDAVLEIFMTRLEIISNAAKIMLGYNTSSDHRTTVDSVAENQEGNRDLNFESAKYALQDLKMAHNMERSQTIAMDNMAKSFWISTGGAILGGFLSAGVGGGFGYFGIGYGIASAVGGATAEWLNSRTSLDASYKEDDEMIEMLKKSLVDPKQDELEKLETQGLLHLLESGQGGKEKKKTERALEAQKMICTALNLRALFMEAGMLEVNITTDFVLSEAGVSSSSGGMIDKYQQRKASLAGKKFSYIKGFLQEKEEVQKRAEKAEKEADHAGINCAISAGVAAVMSIVGGSMVGVGAASAVVTMGMTVLGLCTPLMGLITGINNIIYYLNRSNEEDKAKISDSDRARELRGKQIGSAYDEGGLDKLELQILEEMSRDLISAHGLNTGYFSNFQSRLELLYQIKEIVDDLIAAQSDRASMALRDMLEAFVRGNALLSKVERNNRTAAFTAIESILDSIRGIAENKSELDSDRLMMWRSLVSTSLALVQFCLSFVQISRREESHQIQLKQKAGPLSEDQDKRLAYLSKSGEFLEPLQLSLNIIRILNAFSGTLTTLIYREAEEDKRKEKPSDISAPEKGEKGVGSSIDRMRAETVSAQVAAGQSSLDREGLLEDAEIADEWVGTLHSMLENGVGMFDSLKRERDEKDDELASMQVEQLKEEEKKAEEEREKRIDPFVPIMPSPQPVSPQAAVQRAREDEAVALGQRIQGHTIATST